MAGKNSTDFACGQVLYCLKNSNLNYIVKETPYSAYVTIRKRFIKECVVIQGSIDDTVKVNDDKSQLNDLKEKNKDLETRLAMAKVEFEELEMKIESLTKENQKQDDQVERSLQSEKILQVEIKRLKDGNNCLEQEKDILTKQFDNLRKERLIDTNIEKLKRDKIMHEKRINDLETNIIMLENVVKTQELKILNLKQEVEDRLELEENVSLLENTIKGRDQEVYDLKQELKKIEEAESVNFTDENQPSTSKCGTCEYESDDENDLRMHIKAKHKFQCDLCSYVSEKEEDLKSHAFSIHKGGKVMTDQEFKCDRCELTCKTKLKLKNHICKVEVQNPSYGTLYMKGWYDCHGCTQVYNSTQNKEIAWLHSDHCVLEECAPFRNNSGEIEEAIIEDEVEHLKMECFVERERILWPKLITELKLDQL